MASIRRRWPCVAAIHAPWPPTKPSPRPPRPNPSFSSSSSRYPPPHTRPQPPSSCCRHGRGHRAPRRLRSCLKVPSPTNTSTPDIDFERVSYITRSPPSSSSATIGLRCVDPLRLLLLSLPPSPLVLLGELRFFPLFPLFDLPFAASAIDAHHRDRSHRRSPSRAPTQPRIDRASCSPG